MVTAAAAAQPEPAQQEDIIKSPLDKRLYKRIVLANGLTALLISDPEMAAAIQADGDTADVAGAAGDSEGSEEEDQSDEDDECTESDDASSDDEDGGTGAASKGQQAAKKAAAAMVVGVGSFCDPAELQGLSHYLEHMLFMGSEKYPDENDYDSYLSSHGGSSNAYTELELTNYQFDCEPKALHGALDRFAQFFLAPLCKADALEREVSAVDNEFAGVQQSDGCRMAQLRCHTAVEGHPYRGFSWGNRASLWDRPKAAGIPIRDRIVEYYSQQYSAERMSLVVLGGHDLATLEQWVAELFSGVSAGRGARPTFQSAGLPFQGGRLYGMPAVKDVHSVTVTFQLPSLQAAYATKADEYLSHLVGHEGAGSLLSALKARGWATALSAGVAEGGHERSSAAWLFDVNITLTDAGLAAAPGGGLAPVALLFQFINLLRGHGPQEWVFEELRNIAEMKFRFAEEEDACEYVTRLAADMHLYAPSHVLKGSWLYGKWDPKLVTQLLEHMTPGEVRIDVQTKAWDAVSGQLRQMPGAEEGTEPWFKLPYVGAALPETLLADWAAAAPAGELSLPPRNAFIASDFWLVAEPVEADNGAPIQNGTAKANGADSHTNGHHPQAAAAFPEPPALAEDTTGLRLWHKTDTTFHVPRTTACFLLACPQSYTSAKAAGLTHLVVKLLEDALCETAYQADVAGLSCETSPEGAAGIAVRFDGFSHRLPALTDVVFQIFANLKVEEAAFQRVRESLARRYRNANMRPEQAANYARLFALRASMWHVDAVLPHLEAATPQDVQEHLAAILSSTHLECLLHGNLTAADARAVAAAARKALGGQLLSASECPVDCCMRIPPGASLYREAVMNEKEENSVAEVYLQCGADSSEERARVDLLEQIAGEPVYDTLRTKQQLGYSVHGGKRLTHGALGYCVVVASGTLSPAVLEQRIEAFLQGFSKTLAEMPAEEFERHRASLLAAKLQKDRALSDEADRHWEAIFNRRYNFRAREEEVAALRQLQQAELVAWYDAHIMPGGAARCKLCVHVIGRAHGSEAAQPAEESTAVITDIASWKAAADREQFPPATGQLPPGYAGTSGNK